VIGGGAVGIVLIGLLVFLGIHAFGGDDAQSGPTTSSSRPATRPTAAATTASSAMRPVAKVATEAAGPHAAATTVNTAQGGTAAASVRNTRGLAIFQFQSDGTIIGVDLTSERGHQLTPRSPSTRHCRRSATTRSAARSKVRTRSDRPEVAEVGSAG
jgi:hypothetical protein